MAMDNTKRIVASIIKFLEGEIQAQRPTEELTESLEVAMQCLQSSYEINANEISNDPPLPEIFKKGTSILPNPFSCQPDASLDAKAEAEKCKVDGNNLVKASQTFDAIEQYTKAIQFDCKNAVFYCNRAAAYNKLGNYYAAIIDCKSAIQLDPTYSKAYGRLGVAYASMKMHREAMECYRKALELEPENETYRSNYQLSENIVEEQSASGGNATSNSMRENLASGGMQFSHFLNNPALVNIATEVLSDPNMQSLMNNLLAGNGIDAIMQAGQTLAQQMQASNPELIESLRRQVSGAANPNPDEQQPPPAPPREP